MCIAIDFVSRLAEGDILFCSKIYFLFQMDVEFLNYFIVVPKVI